MDLGVRLVQDTEGAVTRPLGPVSQWEQRNVMHMFTGIEITPKGIDMMADYVAAVREQVGMEVPPIGGPLWAHWPQ
jgi:hypothetical protein